MVAVSWGRSSRRSMGMFSLSSVTSWALSMLLFSSVEFASAKSAADYFVRSLPGAPAGPLLKMHAG